MSRPMGANEVWRPAAAWSVMVRAALAVGSLAILAAAGCAHHGKTALDDGSRCDRCKGGSCERADQEACARQAKARLSAAADGAAAAPAGAAGTAAGAPGGTATAAATRAAEVQPDLAGAAALYDRACKAGHMVSCAALGLQVQDGRGVPRDPQRAMALYRRACDGGAGIGCFDLALMVRDGQVEGTDPAGAQALFDRARAAYQTSCAAGGLDWCMNLGFMYEYGQGLPKDLARAMALYKQACDTKIGTWCVNLAMDQLDSGVAPAKGPLALLEKTCAAKVPLGCGALGHLYLNGARGVAADPAKGAALLARACGGADKDSCAELGAVLALGRSVPADPARGLRLEQRACALGRSDACHVAGADLTSSGDRAEAARWFEQGCNIGDAGSCAIVGAMIEQGDVGPADVSRALALYRRACSLGDMGSCAELFQRGKPLPLPAERRASFLSEACKRGIPGACDAH